MPAIEKPEVKAEFDAASEESRLKTWEDIVARLHARNPTMATNRPQDLDWQAIKSEGRRY
jgi:hypothetical protein